MEKNLRKIISLVLVLAMSFAISVPAFAANTDNLTFNEVVVGSPKENVGATLTFIDHSLSKNRQALSVASKYNIVVPMAEPHEEYDHSYYTYDHRAISSYNVGPRINDVFLISVARGNTKTLSSTKTISGTISFTGSVDAKIKSVVSIGVGLTASGTYTKTWSTTQQFSGPSAPYNSRDYYGAINFDLYSCYVIRYDVYRQYNGSAYTGNRTYNRGITTVSGVKVPKAVEYSKDLTQ